MEAIVTPATPTTIPIGSISIDQTCQLYYQVLPFLGNVSKVHENMMLPNVNTFLFLTIEGPSMDKKDEHRSIIKHEDEGACEENKNGVFNGDFHTLKPP